MARHTEHPEIKRKRLEGEKWLRDRNIKKSLEYREKRSMEMKERRKKREAENARLAEAENARLAKPDNIYDWFASWF